MKKANGNLHLHALERIYVYNMFCGDYTDDIELVRGKAESPGTPNLKKSRSLGGSLKKLFRRGRKQDRSQGETSRESSFSRSSTRNVSQGPSRDGSLSRNADPKDMQYQQTLISQHYVIVNQREILIFIFLKSDYLY